MAMAMDDVQEQLDLIALKWMAAQARETCPRGDQEAALSAFASEVAGSEYAHRFPELEPNGRVGR